VPRRQKIREVSISHAVAAKIARTTNQRVSSEVRQREASVK
jgi:hypothetical protein